MKTSQLNYTGDSDNCVFGTRLDLACSSPLLSPVGLEVPGRKQRTGMQLTGETILACHMHSLGFLPQNCRDWGRVAAKKKIKEMEDI